LTGGLPEGKDTGLNFPLLTKQPEEHTPFEKPHRQEQLSSLTLHKKTSPANAGEASERMTESGAY